MTRRAMARMGLAVAITGVALVGTAGIASAESASGNCAAHMVNSHTWPGGMQIAMSVDNPKGNGVPGGTTGMWGAITHSC